ncbi:MAG: hypothetical protein HGA19_24405 [Oscillochloris sp.]|nr:hypothetical protein [Oscillochloris sp.]
MISGKPPPMRIMLSVLGLIAIAISMGLAFINPVGIWHWALLIVALACLIASRRIH